MSCGVGHRCGSDPALLWLWCGLAATALIRPLAMCHGCSPPQKKEKKRERETYLLLPTWISQLLSFFSYSTGFHGDFSCFIRILRSSARVQWISSANGSTHKCIFDVFVGGGKLPIHPTPLPFREFRTSQLLNIGCIVIKNPSVKPILCKKSKSHPWDKFLHRHRWHLWKNGL